MFTINTKWQFIPVFHSSENYVLLICLVKGWINYHYPIQDQDSIFDKPITKKL